MAIENSPEKSIGVSAGTRFILVVISLMVFVVASSFNPELVWPLLVAFCASVLALWMFSERVEEKKAARSKLEESSSAAFMKSIQTMSEALQYPVFVIDERANVKLCNRASRSVFDNITLGDRIFIRFRQPDLKRAIEKAMANKTSESIEYNEPIPDDRWFTVEISPLVSELEERRGGETLFLIGFHELTETKRIDKMRSDFIANASHELRTPLASLVGYLETLKGPAKNDPKAQGKFIDTMLDQAERMSRLVNDLLSLSRIEMKSHLRPVDTVDLTEVITTVINSLEGLAHQMGVEIEFEAMHHFMVNGERDELIQVFENIIENGCKYGQDGKRVLVQLSEEKPDQVVVRVQDFGPGIELEYQHRITERFYRVDVARSRQKQGTGLGLAIVKHILQRHNTRLVVNSKPGDGAEFIVRLKQAEPVKENKKVL